MSVQTIKYYSENDNFSVPPLACSSVTLLIIFYVRYFSFFFLLHQQQNCNFHCWLDNYASLYAYKKRNPFRMSLLTASAANLVIRLAVDRIVHCCSGMGKDDTLLYEESCAIWIFYDSYTIMGWKLLLSI